MAFVEYTGIRGANEALNKIRDFALAQGWTILLNCEDDYPVDSKGDPSAATDGKRLVMQNKAGTVFASFRSANGRAKIFERQANAPEKTDDGKGNAYGIGLIGHTAYKQRTSSGCWYDQPEVTREYTTGQAIGVGVPINPNVTYTMYANAVKDPADLLIFSFFDGAIYQHFAVGYLEKVGNWDGGLIVSGSRNSYNMFASKFESTSMESESVPLFSMTQNATTFLRIDMDNAPKRQKQVLWASAGKNAPADFTCMYTGKQMALPVKNREVTIDSNASWNAFIPDYRKIMSENATDTGRNVNTLNCITVNMNLIVYVIRDPDDLRNFSPVGYVPGTYFVSLRNVAPAQCYEISYPTSGGLHQVFPYTRRRGVFGMDGFAVKQ